MLRGEADRRGIDEKLGWCLRKQGRRREIRKVIACCEGFRC